ncbi:MAG: ShlB/FhaC/HecB family hemolysin secretion/activation protein, partial [Methylococcaceae bacterium]|nr:ShlB/FhaC/HecB family hemolysin secretion/activation protein [Methylococcaceae bacterium]
IDGSVYYGNSGMRAVGQNVYGGNLNLNNPLRVGDQASLQVQGGSSNVFGRVSYSLPVGYSGLRIGVRGSGMNYDLDALFSKLEATGESWNGGAFASYPLWRSMDFNLNAQAGFDNRRYSSKQLQKLTNATQLNVGYAGLDLNSRDDLLGGGVNALGFTTYIGDADLSDNSENLTLDRRTARSNGGYQKFVFNASRLQQLSEDFSFRTDLSGQIATRNLYSGEKFALGGPYGVRAYPVNEGLGDEGYLAKFELRYKAHDYVQLFGFIDTGGTTLHVNPWGQSKIPSHYTLSGGGLGIDLIVPKQFEINFSVAQRIGSNPAATNTGKDNDGSNRTPHFWLQINKFF